MELAICSFEIAKQLKEIGFDNETLHFYTKPRSKMFGIDEHGRAYPMHNTSKKLYTCGEDATLNSESVYSAPTLALVQMWFDKEHDIDIHITRGAYSYPIPSNMNSKKKFMTVIYSPLHERGFQLKGIKSTYDQALEAGILEAIKLIKPKQDELERTIKSNKLR